MKVRASWHKAAAFVVMILSIFFFLPSMASPRRGGQPRKTSSQQSSAAAGAGPAQTTTPTATNSKNLAAAYGHLPMRFEENVGQTDGQVRFLSRGSGYTLFLTTVEAVFVLHPQTNGTQLKSKFYTGSSVRSIFDPNSKSSPPSGTQGQRSVLRMKLM